MSCQIDGFSISNFFLSYEYFCWFSRKIYFLPSYLNGIAMHICFMSLSSFPFYNKALRQFQLLNNLHPSSKFTMEREENIISFGDILNERITKSSVTNIYGRPPFIGLYLRIIFPPKFEKLISLKSLPIELMIYSGLKLELELKRITDIFLSNVYLERFILNALKCEVFF